MAGLVVASAGCIAQDKPEAPQYYVVADAGPDQVVAAGSTAHFEWSAAHAVEVEAGAAPQAAPEYAWSASGATAELSTTADASLSRADPGLDLVSLQVTVEGASATDAAAVLFVPPESDTAVRAFVAVVGAIRFSDAMGSPQNVHDVSLGDTQGQWAEVALEATQPTTVEFDFAPSDVALGTEVHGSVLVAVKRGAGPAVVEMTGPVTFDPSFQYEVSIPRNAGAPTLWEVPRTAGPSVEHTFPDYAAANPGEAEARTLVSESQSLPGFSAAATVAAVGALAGLALAGGRRRR